MLISQTIFNWFGSTFGFYITWPTLTKYMTPHHISTNLNHLNAYISTNQIPIKNRPFGGWCGGQVGGVVVEADKEDEVENEVEEFEVEVDEVEVEVKAEAEVVEEVEVVEVVEEVEEVWIWIWISPNLN